MSTKTEEDTGFKYDTAWLANAAGITPAACRNALRSEESIQKEKGASQWGTNSKKTADEWVKTLKARTARKPGETAKAPAKRRGAKK